MLFEILFKISSAFCDRPPRYRIKLLFLVPIAGTSCVDYSNLNNEKKGLDDGGESGQTFKGMMDWVDR